MSRSSLAALALAGVAACGGVEPAGSTAVFPADYAESYVEVRDCRKSADHELEFVRVLADPAAAGPYQARSGDFPEGAVVLKEQYDASDDTCAGPVAQWTVMQKTHAADEQLGWSWQRVDTARRVVGASTTGCVSCHSACTGEAGGYDATCADP